MKLGASIRFALVLLCLIGFFSLVGNVGADPQLLPPEELARLERDWSQYVIYNVTDTGTFVLDGSRDIIICDHGKTYTNVYWTRLFAYPFNASETGWTASNNGFSRRVFFTIGIVGGQIYFYPEDPPPTFIVYHMAHVPFDANMIRLFNSRVGQQLYDRWCDFNEDGIINMRDISITIKHFALPSP